MLYAQSFRTGHPEEIHAFAIKDSFVSVLHMAQYLTNPEQNIRC